MPPWLVEMFSQLSPEGSATGFLGALATLIASVIVKVVAERRKLDRAVQSVPPTVCPVPRTPSQGTVIATARQIWDLEQEISDLRKRLVSVDADRKAVAADAVRTAQALVESQGREEALKDELAELRGALESGHTRLPLPPSRTRLTPIDVVEINDEKTPRQGRGRTGLR